MSSQRHSGAGDNGKRFEMKIRSLSLLALPLILGAAAAHAEEGETSRFAGAKIGANLSYDRLSIDRNVAGVTPRVDTSRGGIGGRVFAGYDFATGPLVLGAEAGLGVGGRTARQTVSNGRYAIDPGLNWDLTARAGVAVAPSVLLFGRAGYRWQRLRTDLVQGTVTTSKKTSDGGLTFGGGAEFAVGEALALRAEYARTSFGEGLKANQLRLGAVLRF
jgi:outer membrane immunogenic protein